MVANRSQVEKLRKLVEHLQRENTELNHKLNSKRYHFIDNVINTTYKPVIALNKIYASKHDITKRSDSEEQIIKADLTNEKYTTPKKRSFIKGKVYILNYNFFDHDGENVYKGGAERYVYDLAVLLKKNGYKPSIVQISNKNFNKKYNGGNGAITVIGLGTKNKDLRNASAKLSNFSKDAEFVIVSPLELACELDDNIPAIAINHGVNFDGPWVSADNEDRSWTKLYTDALSNVSLCVCVDTNFINWMRTHDYKSSTKLVYIPNYYDKNIFRPTKKTKNNKKIVCVYPRRIYSARGYDITLDAFSNLFKQYSDYLELYFIGQYDNAAIKRDVEKLIKQYPNNVFHTEYDMGDMHKAYEIADIVLIPTRFSEGTSLSCIEGLASGTTVVATNVGGLPNLIIDHYNGLLISPTAEAIEQAILELLKDKNLRTKLALNGAEVVTVFEKKNWDKRWTQIIKKLLKKEK